MAVINAPAPDGPVEMPRGHGVRRLAARSIAGPRTQGFGSVTDRVRTDCASGDL